MWRGALRSLWKSILYHLCCNIRFWYQAIYLVYLRHRIKWLAQNQASHEYQRPEQHSGELNVNCLCRCLLQTDSFSQTLHSGWNQKEFFASFSVETMKTTTCWALLKICAVLRFRYWQNLTPKYLLNGISSSRWIFRCVASHLHITSNRTRLDHIK